MITLNDVEIFNGLVEQLQLGPDRLDEMRALVDTRNADDLERFLAGCGCQGRRAGLCPTGSAFREARDFGRSAPADD